MNIAAGSHVVRIGDERGKIWTVNRVRGELLTIEGPLGESGTVHINSIHEHIPGTTHHMVAPANGGSMRCKHCKRTDVTSDSVCVAALALALR